MTPPIRVLVVDDSAFARKVLREVLAGHPDIQVVGWAMDGLDALEKIAQLAPDVVTLDLVMPNLDGLGVLRAVPRDKPPRFVVVSIADEQSDLGVQALQAGAFDVVHKPTALAVTRLYQLGDEIVAKVRAAGSGARHEPPKRTSAPPPLPSGVARVRTQIVVLGASTGGPHAVTQVLRALPATFPVPLAVVVHMPFGYTEAFARRLDGISALDVTEARDGMTFGPGQVVVARAGMHLKLLREGDKVRARLDIVPIDSLHRPSVDMLFESAAHEFGAGVLGVVMTGMGTDGLLGGRAIRAAKGRLITEAASSCVVYGMPRAVFQDGLAFTEAPLDGMANAIVAAI